ncbi:MAG: hypothetical protein KatS3mg077_0610 [Candidatus Binatia bacterium]|nr:MAG: hypothetical protein KatS3mg077_0610 [Candidatus Binatia bacterium]
MNGTITGLYLMIAAQSPAMPLPVEPGLAWVLVAMVIVVASGLLWLVTRDIHKRPRVGQRWGDLPIARPTRWREGAARPS